MNLIHATALAGCLALSGAAHAVSVAGLTFTIQRDSSPTYSSSETRRAFLGDFGHDVFYRGFSEFSLSGIGISETAILSFNFQRDALNAPPPPLMKPITGRTVDVTTYLGDGVQTPDYPGSRDRREGDPDNLIGRSEFHAPSTGVVGTFAIDDFIVGDLIQMDITDAVRAGIGNGDSFLGVKLTPNFSMPFVTFDNFTINTTEPVLSGVPTIPEPETYAMLLLGLVAVRLSQARNRS
jgi:hypothetical protein